MSYRISIEGVTIGVHYESSAFKCLGCILFLCFEGNWGIVIDERVKSFFDDWLNIISFGNVVLSGVLLGREGKIVRVHCLSLSRVVVDFFKYY